MTHQQFGVERPERRQAEHRAQRRALDQLSREELILLLTRDELTGLGNRRGLQEAERAADEAGEQFSYGVLDVEGLKWVNDEWGHAAGDALLAAVGWCLHCATANAGGAQAFRTGGDEFVLFGDEARVESCLWAARAQLNAFAFYWRDGAEREWGAVGADFDFGLGDTLAVADAELLFVRNSLTETGDRARRGEKPEALTLVATGRQ